MHVNERLPGNLIVALLLRRKRRRQRARRFGEDIWEAETLPLGWLEQEGGYEHTCTHTCTRLWVPGYSKDLIR